MDVLITHRNQGRLAEQSLASLLEQLPPDSEVFVVDAGSTDGTYAQLERLAARGDINLELQTGISRGAGRQVAFERSDSEVVMAHVDLDSLLAPVLPRVLEVYRELVETSGPSLLLFHGGMIGDRGVIERAGGWRDLQVHEDKDLWLRVDEVTDVFVLPISVVQSHANFEWESVRYRLRRIYQNYRDGIRLGVTVDELVRSQRAHLPWAQRPLERSILMYAARRASDAEQFGLLPPRAIDPDEHFLRELTFHSLESSDVFDPRYIEPPTDLAEYGWNGGYPGKTSYHRAGQR